MAKILFVDDEQSVLQGIVRNLSDDFEIDTAGSGSAAIQRLKEETYAVIVSDMRMPEMNGAKLLKHVYENYSRSVRMLLTGQSDIDDATAAVNDGHIFRLLHKPCSLVDLTTALMDALKQYEVQQVEKRLLEETLQGTIKVMCDVLSIANPVAFGRANRIRKTVSSIAEKLALESRHELEIAALLSQLGCIAIDESIMEKVSTGKSLDDDERQQFLQHPQIGKNLLEAIPRMAAIARVIGDQNKNYDGTGFPEDNRVGYDVPLGSRILHVACDFDLQTANGQTAEIVLARMARRADLYDHEIVETLASVVTCGGTSRIARLRLVDVKIGMTFEEDVLACNGRLLVGKGQEASDVNLTKLQVFNTHFGVQQPILVSGVAINSFDCEKADSTNRHQRNGGSQHRDSAFN